MPTMLDAITVTISVLALAVSIVTAWLTLTVITIYPRSILDRFCTPHQRWAE